MDGDAATGIVAMVVILGIIAVFLVFVIKSATKRTAMGQQMMQGPTAKTGLVGAGSHFEGNFQGFWAAFDVHLDFNVAGIAWSGRFGGARAFFHRYAFVMRVPGANFPPTTFYERDWLGRLGDVEWQRRAPIGTQGQSGVPALDAQMQTFVTDPQFAWRVAQSPELQQAMMRWPFLNLQIAGDAITLELIEAWNQLEWKFGAPAMYGWDFALQGLQMMAAAARAAMAAQPMAYAAR
jgi:hypothetical protein